MLLIKVVAFLTVLVFLVTCKNVRKREIDQDFHHYAIGPTIQPHEAHLYRYQVAFREKCSQNCGGTIISDRHILTAAHCAFGSDPRPMTIKAGVTYVDDPNGQIRDVLAVKTHNNYDHYSLHNDVALLTLQEPLNLNGLTVAKLPNQNEDFEGEFVEATGWGNTVNLTYAHFTVRNNSECNHPSHICTDPYPNMRTYSGDSGGPVIHRSGNDVILVGIVSGKSHTGQHLFTNVAYLRSWIDAAMKEANELVYVTKSQIFQLPKHQCTN